MNFKEISKLQDRIFSKDDHYYENQTNLENEDYYFNFNRFKHEYADCLEKKSRNIDLGFLFSKLHCFHEMLNNEYTNNKNFLYEKTFFDEILKSIESNKKGISKNHPNIYVIYNVILMWTTSDDKYLNELLNYLKSNEGKFSKEQLIYYYYYLVNYHLIKFNIGEIQYREGAHDIYKIMFEKDLFIIDNIITDTDFNSVINIMLPFKEYGWLIKFIEKYKDFLDPKFAKEAYNLAIAKLYFQQKDYNKVFPYLNEVDYKEPFYYLHSKFILARLYFDMGNYKSLTYVINNLRQYIREKKILTEEYRLLAKTFIKYISKLIKLIEGGKKDKKAELKIFKKQLDNEKNFVSNKNWFYEKIKKL